MPYTRVNWKDGSGNAGGDTPLDAANLNQMDAGIAAAVPLDGSAPMTGMFSVNRALASANKTFIDMNATDGKRYQFIIRTDGSLVLWNATDSKNVAVWYPAGVSTILVYDGALTTIRETKKFIGTVDPATYTTPQEGDEWSKV